MNIAAHRQKIPREARGVFEPFLTLRLLARRVDLATMSVTMSAVSMVAAPAAATKGQADARTDRSRSSHRHSMAHSHSCGSTGERGDGNAHDRDDASSAGRPRYRLAKLLRLRPLQRCRLQVLRWPAPSHCRATRLRQLQVVALSLSCSLLDEVFDPACRGNELRAKVPLSHCGNARTREKIIRLQSDGNRGRKRPCR